jgi:hypothetical protein
MTNLAYEGKLVSLWWKKTITYVEVKNQIKHLHHRNGSRISLDRYPLCIAVA